MHWSLESYIGGFEVIRSEEISECRMSKDREGHNSGGAEDHT